jgi:hypothetical protein
LVDEILTDMFARPTGSNFALASADQPSWRLLIGDDMRDRVLIEVSDPETLGGPEYPAAGLVRLHALGLRHAGVDDRWGRRVTVLELGSREARAKASMIVTSVLTEVFGIAGCADLTLVVKAGEDLMSPRAPVDRPPLGQERALRNDPLGQIADRVDVLRRTWYEISALHSHTKLWSMRVGSVSWAHKDLLPYFAYAEKNLVPWLSPELRRDVRKLWGTETTARTIKRITICRAPFARMLGGLAPAINVWDLLLAWIHRVGGSVPSEPERRMTSCAGL